MMFIGDVGQSSEEEINVANAGEAGLNLGWDCREGSIDAVSADQPHCGSGRFIEPAIDYDHEDGRCAVIGGSVYRGTQHPELRGFYLYADHCSGEVWALGRTPEGRWVDAPVAAGMTGITSFGEDAEGEMVATTLDGRLWRITRAERQSGP